MIIIETVSTPGLELTTSGQSVHQEVAVFGFTLAKQLEVGILQHAICSGAAVNSKPGSAIIDATAFKTRTDWFLDTTRLLKPMGILVNPLLHHQHCCLVPELGGDGGWLLNYTEWAAWYRSCLACPVLSVLLYAGGVDPDCAGRCSSGLYYDRMIHYDATIDLVDCTGSISNDILSSLLVQHDLVMQRAAYERAVRYYPIPMPRG